MIQNRMFQMTTQIHKHQKSKESANYALTHVNFGLDQRGIRTTSLLNFCKVLVVHKEEDHVTIFCTTAQILAIIEFLLFTLNLEIQLFLKPSICQT